MDIDTDRQTNMKFIFIEKLKYFSINKQKVKIIYYNTYSVKQ